MYFIIIINDNFKWTDFIYRIFQNFSQFTDTLYTYIANTDYSFVNVLLQRDHFLIYSPYYFLKRQLLFYQSNMFLK